MTLADRFFANWAPTFQMRRLQARAATQRWDVAAKFEAAQVSRIYSAKRATGGPNKDSGTGAKSLREQARDLEQNYDIAKGALDILVMNTVGQGIRPEPMVMSLEGTLDEEANALLSTLYNRWAHRPEVTRTMSDAMAQRLAARTFFRDGEVLIRHRTGTVRGLTHRTAVPYSYELIEPELCPYDYQSEQRKIIQGVSLNEWFEPRLYHIAKVSPTDELAETWRLGTANELVGVPADLISVARLVQRIRQIRGVSLFAPAFTRLRDIKDIDEAERVAARISAVLAAVIVKGDASAYHPPGDGGEYRELELEPGLIGDYLRPGEKVEAIASNRPNNEIIPFRDAQLRAAASAFGVSASALSKNYNGTYSAQRQELVEQHGSYGVLHDVLVESLERPKWQKFVEAAVAARQIPPEILSRIDRQTLYDAEFSRPAMPWIDPLKEAKAWGELVEKGFESRAAVIRSRGKDPRRVERQRAREEALNPTPASAGRPPQDPETNEPEEGEDNEP